MTFKRNIKKKMLAMYLSAIGVLGIGCSLVASNYFFGKGKNRYRNYYNPVSFSDRINKTYLYYFMPVLVSLCGVSGLGMLLSNFASHVVVPASSKYASYFMKFYLFAPIGAGFFNFVSTLGAVAIDHEQSGPGAAACIFLAGVANAVLAEGIMVFMTMNASSAENAEFSAIWYSFFLAGPISFLSLLWGRAAASD